MRQRNAGSKRRPTHSPIVDFKKRPEGSVWANGVGPVANKVDYRRTFASHTKYISGSSASDGDAIAP